MYRLTRPVLLWLSGAYVILQGAYTILQSLASLLYWSSPDQLPYFRKYIYSISQHPYKIQNTVQGKITEQN
jgi:hypothetical protein